MLPITMRAQRGALQVVAAIAVMLFGSAVMARSSGASLSVVVLPQRFVAADVAFPDLDTLHGLVAAVNPSLLTLHVCDPRSIGAFLAAAERFRTLRLQLRVLAPADARCVAARVARPVAETFSLTLVNQSASPRHGLYWNSVLP